MSTQKAVPDSVRLEILPGGRYFINPVGPAVLGFFDHPEIGAELIRRFNGYPEMAECISTLTAERDSAKRELAELQADAKAERKKYEALREENAALKAECMVTLRALIEEDAAVIYRVTSKIIAARATPPAKEPK